MELGSKTTELFMYEICLNTEILGTTSFALIPYTVYLKVSVICIYIIYRVISTCEVLLSFKQKKIPTQNTQVSATVNSLVLLLCLHKTESSDLIC